MKPKTLMAFFITKKKRKVKMVNLYEPDQKIVIGGVMYHCFIAPNKPVSKKSMDY